MTVATTVVATSTTGPRAWLHPNPNPTLFLTITLSRSHPSIVQFICCERVLTMRKVRHTDDAPWPIADGVVYYFELCPRYDARGFLQSRIAEGPRDAPCMDLFCNHMWITCNTYILLRNINVDLLIYIMRGCKVAVVSACVCVIVCVWGWPTGQLTSSS